MQTHALVLFTVFVVEPADNVCYKGLRVLLIDMFKDVPSVLNCGRVLNPVKGSVGES